MNDETNQTKSDNQIKFAWIIPDPIVEKEARNHSKTESKSNHLPRMIGLSIKDQTAGDHYQTQKNQNEAQ